MVVPPEYVFVPVKVSAPDPNLVRDPPELTRDEAHVTFKLFVLTLYNCPDDVLKRLERSVVLNSFNVPPEKLIVPVEIAAEDPIASVPAVTVVLPE